MKSSITNCNSNDQLLQLVPIMLLQKATSHHPKWQQLLVLVAVQFLSGNFRIWQQSWRTERHQLKEAAHRAVQPMPEATWASTWQLQLPVFQFRVLLPSTAHCSLQGQRIKLSAFAGTKGEINYAPAFSSTIHRGHKKGHFFLTITLANVDRFQ